MKFLLAMLRKPIVLLLAVTLVIGLFLFRDYGLTWDEPLFYKYGEALGYAYTPANWFSGHFDLNQSYGPSGDDHKNRGPGYLLLAREPVALLEALHIDMADAWHLINFVTFLLGVYFVYRLAERLMQPWAAFGAAALFAFQPLLWGHAFINPKDMPFLVFLTGSVWLGFRMVDQLTDSPAESSGQKLRHVLLPAFMLGIATANRVLGPLAGLLVLAYFVTQRPRREAVIWMALYAADRSSGHVCGVALPVGDAEPVRRGLSVHVREPDGAAGAICGPGLSRVRPASDATCPSSCSSR